MMANYPKHPPVIEQKPQYGERKESFYTKDESLRRILHHYLPKDFYQYAEERLKAYGERCANEIDERARFTDREGEPQLLKYDAYGDDISEVIVNEGYRQTVEETYNEGIVGYVHKPIPELGRKGNYTYSFAQGYVLSQAEPGFYCPVTLTKATAYLLDHYADEAVKKRFLPHVCSTGEVSLYEGATFLTERQGGSDVGANEVVAVEEDDGTYSLYGEKYFASNAGMCGVAMVLARREGAPTGSKGLTLFAVPWRNEDGTLNGISIRRLKDKLGVKAVPSGEVELNGAKAYVVGDPTRGFYYMMEALNLSRVSNAVASLGIMKRSLDEAFQYATKRRAFGGYLTDYPMVRDTLLKMKAKLHVELAALFDMIQLYEKVTAGEGTPEEVVLNRLNIATMKKETAYEAIHFAHEAIEMLGGNGYIEDFVTPRLLRDAQVLSVWEGTANILGLEVVRLVNKYEAHQLFIEQMNARLEKIAPSDQKSIVLQQWASVQEALHRFADLTYEEQTFYSKKMSSDMNAIYESVIALEWAERYGEEYEVLANIYLEQTWQLRKIGQPIVQEEIFWNVFSNA